MNKNILAFICMVILVVIAMLVSMLVLTANKNKCINNGGKVITDNSGFYDKCIYGDDK